jgi:hypothetical protein
VIRHPHWRKENQCVMNRKQSTSIWGKHHPENHKGEGNTPNAQRPAVRKMDRAKRDPSSRRAHWPHSRCNAARGTSPGAAAAGRAGAAADRTTGIAAVAVGEATMISSPGGGSRPAAA